MYLYAINVHVQSLMAFKFQKAEKCNYTNA